MSMQTYSLIPSRNLIRAEAEMLAHAVPIEVLARFGMTKEQPTRKTDTVVFRRLNPYNMQTAATFAGGTSTTVGGIPGITAANFVLQEGVTPTPNTIAYTDVVGTLQQYGVLFRFSSKVELMYEDDIPADMKILTGETLAEVGELIRYGVYKAGTSVQYANGSSRSAVNTAISINKLRLCLRQLEMARARRVNKMVGPSVKYFTQAVPAGFPVFIHTDVEADVRALGLNVFIPVERYPAETRIHEREIGAVENFRFITSPLLIPFLAAGSATLGTCYSVGGANVDVYPVIIMGQDAWASVPLRGRGAVSPTILPASMKNHANPSGQFGYVGADFWITVMRLNENWMVRLEVGVTQL